MEIRRTRKETQPGEPQTLRKLKKKQQFIEPLEQALRAATSTPADAIGLSGVGRLAVGQPADFVALDNLLYVTRTWSRLVSLRG